MIERIISSTIFGSVGCLFGNTVGATFPILDGLGIGVLFFILYPKKQISGEKK